MLSGLSKNKTISNLRIWFVTVMFAATILGVASPFFARPAFAATANIDPNGEGFVSGGYAATPSGTRYTTIDDGIRQPTTPTTSDYISVLDNENSSAFFTMSTVSNVATVSSVQVWLYHNDNTNGFWTAALMNDAENTTYGADQNFAYSASNAWGSVTFSGLSLTQSQLDGLKVRMRVGKTGGAAKTIFAYAMYATVTYTSSSVLTVDIVDGSGNTVSNPSLSMSSVNSSLSCQTTTGTLGSSSQKIRVSNLTANGNWTLSLAATSGAAASWSNGSSSYDFNDGSGTPAGCGDGGDADSLAGRLTVDPSVGTLTPQSLCSSSGITKGSSTAFAQGSTDNITLLTASGSQALCYYDLTGVSLSQQVPPETPASGSAYTINMTLTVTAN